MLGSPLAVTPERPPSIEHGLRFKWIRFTRSTATPASSASRSPRYRLHVLCRVINFTSRYNASVTRYPNDDSRWSLFHLPCKHWQRSVNSHRLLCAGNRSRRQERNNRAFIDEEKITDRKHEWTKTWNVIVCDARGDSSITSQLKWARFKYSRGNL